MDTLGDRIKQVRAQSGLSQESFAKALGVTRGAIGNWELGGGVDTDNLIAMASKFSVPLEWLAKGVGSPPGVGSSAAPHGTPGNARYAGPMQWGAHVPLMGQGAAGPDGRFQFNGERVADIAAPASLANVRGAYAVYVVGDSMEPRYFAGETVFVDPNRPARRGDFVVVQVAGDEGEPPAGYIKRMISREARILKLEQFNPKKVLQIPSPRVQSIHRIIMAGEG